MKKQFILLSFALFSLIGFSQITFYKHDAGTVKTNIGNGFLNEKSSLNRQWIVLNDFKCPLKLDSITGIGTIYLNSSQCYFIGEGSCVTNTQIVAYELHHILYDVFGNYMLTLSETVLEDVSSSTFVRRKEWPAEKNQIIKYLSCVSYVASIRTQKGIIWKYNPALIKIELNKRLIPYEESYKPKI